MRAGVPCVDVRPAQYNRRLSRAFLMPSVSCSISRSHTAPVPNPLITMRTTHVPPENASTRHSVANVAAGAPSARHRTSPVANLRGGSHAVTFPESFLPEPISKANVPPTRSSTVVGCSQALMPGPVAIASHTCSGVPVTSTSRLITRESSSAVMRSPPGWERTASGEQPRPAGATGRRASRDRDSGKQGKSRIR